MTASHRTSVARAAGAFVTAASLLIAGGVALASAAAATNDGKGAPSCATESPSIDSVQTLNNEQPVTSAKYKTTHHRPRGCTPLDRLNCDEAPPPPAPDLAIARSSETSPPRAQPCATITVYKHFEGQKGFQAWTFTVASEGLTINGKAGISTEDAAAGSDAGAYFELDGLGEDGQDVTISEKPRAGFKLVEVTCGPRILEIEEDDPDGVNGPDLPGDLGNKMRLLSAPDSTPTYETPPASEGDGWEPGTDSVTGRIWPADDIVCTFIKKKVATPTPTRTTTSTTTPSPTPTPTPTASVLGEKESATPSPTPTALGGALPFTGAPVRTGVVFALMLLGGGGALLLAGARRRGTKHRG